MTIATRTQSSPLIAGVFTCGLAALTALGAAPMFDEPMFDEPMFDEPAAAEPAPVFSAPTEITNTYAPFTPDSVKIFFGRDGGARTVVLERQLPQTRMFDLEGTPVEARIIQESEFVDGELEEITTHYVAQDDAGNVRYFGEVAVNYDGGVVVGTESDSWVVDGPGGSEDPPGVHVARSPAMYMPATLELGTTFDAESFPGMDEILIVVGIEANLNTPAEDYALAYKIQENSEDDPGAPIQFRWVVPGLGVVKEVAPQTRHVLMATSLLEFDTLLDGAARR